MKLSKLLVLSALWLGLASSVSAAIVDGVRQKPVPQTTGFVASTTEDFQTNYYYLYNVDAGLFFTEGNAWGTQVSLSTSGLKAAFTPDGDYPLAYLFHDFSVSKNSWKLVFFDNENQMFVDHNNQANYRWGVEDNGATFRLYAASEDNGNPGWDATTDADGNEVLHPAYREGQYMGWDANSGGNICVPYLTVGDGHCIDWAFVAPAEYDAFAPAIAIYNAAEALRAAIEEYKSKGYTDTAAYEAIYLNEDATLEELQQAKKDLDAAFIEWGKSQASVENPADMTTKIVNPRFDNADATTGWSGTAFGRGGTVSDGAEHWNKSYDTYQKIQGLAPGIYAVGVNGYYRAGNYGGDAERHWVAKDADSKNAKFYATAGENYYEVPLVNVLDFAQTEATNTPGEYAATYQDADGNDVTVYAPNTMACGDYYFHTLNLYANKLYVAVDETGELTIGVKKSVTIDGDWSMFDDFSLTFFGNGTDAWKMFLEDGWTYEVLELDEDEVLYTESYLEAYNAAASIDRSALNTPEEMKAALANAKAAYDALQKNIDLWKQWKQAIENANNRVTDLGWTEPWNKVGGMSDYLYEVEDIEMDRALTNEELEEELAKIQAMITECEDYAKNHLPTGSDVTRYMVNPDFELPNSLTENQTNPDGLSGTYGTVTGWHVDKRASGNFTPGPQGKVNDTSVNHCIESWHCRDFDFWQEVSNLPEGIYQIFVQGYVRDEGPNNSPFAELSNIPVKLYLNNSLNDFPDIYSEKAGDEYKDENGLLGGLAESGNWDSQGQSGYPNSMAAASKCFSWGMYETSAFGPVKAGEPMRIGVKSVNMTTDWWCIFDNFRLKYQGFLPEYVKQALEKALLTVDMEDKQIGADVKENAAALISQANALLGEYASHSADDEAYGRQMFDVLYDIYDIQPAVMASVTLFEKLNEALLNLETALDKYVDSPAYDEAEALRTEVETGINGLTNAQAEEYISKITEMLTKLRLPSDAEIAQASDQAPLDMTSVILAPSFENDEWGYPENSNEGWNNPGNLGNAASDTQADQKLCFAMEFWQIAFDLYQEFYGMPAGTYMLQVDGWVRNGNNDENYTQWQTNPEASMAFLYAKDGEDTYYSAPLANMMKAAPTENIPFITFDGDEIYELVETTLGETAYWLPNTMIGGRSYLDLGKEEGSIDGAYTSKVILKVKEDGKLRIGVKKEQQKDNSWVVIDNFRLFYYGANSSLQPSGNALTVESIAMGQPVKVEFFTLDGRKVNSMQKGIMIQKVTLDNGNVVVRKIRY